MTVVRIIMPRMTEVMTMPTVSTRGPSLVLLASTPLELLESLPPSQKESSRVTSESLLLTNRSELTGLRTPRVAMLGSMSRMVPGPEVRGSRMVVLA